MTQHQCNSYDPGGPSKRDRQSTDPATIARARHSFQTPRVCKPGNHWLSQIYRVLDIWPLPSSGVQLDLCLSMFGSIAIMLPVKRVGPAGARAQQIPGAQVPRQYTLI